MSRKKPQSAMAALLDFTEEPLPVFESTRLSQDVMPIEMIDPYIKTASEDRLISRDPDD